VTMLKLQAQSHKSRLFVIGIGNNLELRSIERLATAGQGVGTQISIGDSNWEAIASSLMEFCSTPSLTGNFTNDHC
jgi:hypothetical protein